MTSTQSLTIQMSTYDQLKKSGFWCEINNLAQDKIVNLVTWFGNLN